jgi:DNA-binding protein HU-beta
MNKTQLVDAIAQQAGISKVRAKRGLEAFISITIDTLKEGDKVALAGFGTFVVTKQPPRTGRNFKTGAIIDIAAKSVVKFRSAIEPE